MATATSTRQAQFETAVWEYYAGHGRNDLPWRQPDSGGQFNPYLILVSEIMLQQTQVSRVIPKYHQFITAFPDIAALATAPLAEVLKIWNGLGYNRRAKFLWEAAQQLHTEHADQFPRDSASLVRLPGVGANTAGAILTYAFNTPAVFIETNVRTVVIYHFFADQTKVADVQLCPILQKALEAMGGQRTPRTWYWALMDYGTYLKQATGNASRKSAGYKKQSAFEGSLRQIRGQVIRMLATVDYSEAALHRAIEDDRLPAVLSALIQEGLICSAEGRYYLRAS